MVNGAAVFSLLCFCTVVPSLRILRVKIDDDIEQGHRTWFQLLACSFLVIKLCLKMVLLCRAILID
jgi:hypothetical protein